MLCVSHSHLLIGDVVDAFALVPFYGVLEGVFVSPGSRALVPCVFSVYVVFRWVFYSLWGWGIGLVGDLEEAFVFGPDHCEDCLVGNCEDAVERRWVLESDVYLVFLREEEYIILCCELCDVLFDVFCYSLSYCVDCFCFY